VNPSIKDILALLVPLIQEIIKIFRDENARNLAIELKSAKTKEDKRNVARKLAEHIYRD